MGDLTLDSGREVARTWEMGDLTLDSWEMGDLTLDSEKCRSTPPFHIKLDIRSPGNWRAASHLRSATVLIVSPHSG